MVQSGQQVQRCNRSCYGNSNYSWVSLRKYIARPQKLKKDNKVKGSDNLVQGAGRIFGPVRQRRAAPGVSGAGCLLGPDRGVKRLRIAY